MKIVLYVSGIMGFSLYLHFLMNLPFKAPSAELLHVEEINKDLILAWSKERAITNAELSHVKEINKGLRYALTNKFKLWECGEKL